MKLTKEDIHSVKSIANHAVFCKMVSCMWCDNGEYISLDSFREAVKELKKEVCQEDKVEQRGSYICGTRDEGSNERCWYCQRVDDLFGEVLE